MRNDINTIRQAVTKNHGGFDDASDEQIMVLWCTLDNDTRSRYLSSLKRSKQEGGHKHAAGDES